MEDTLQLHEFFVEGGNAERSHALLHITEPSTPEEKQKGYFFAVCEIIGSTTEYIEELQQTIDVIEKGYYENNELSSAETLEAVLDQVNKQSVNIIKRGIELHWMVGVITGNEIIFGFHGHPTILLFYKNKEGIYQPLDLVAQNPIDRSATPTIFSQIIQGKISPHDYLAVTTPHVREFYDYDRMQRIITTRSAEESCRHFERAFQESKRELSFAGIIVTVGRTIERRPAPAPRLPQVSHGSSESLQQLFSTEKNTARTLTSSFGKSVQNGLNHLTKRDKKIPQAISPVFEEQSSSRNEDLEPLRPVAAARNRRNERWEKTETKDYVFQIFRTIVTGLITLNKWLFKVVIVLLTTLGALFRFFGTLSIAIINYKGRRQIIFAGWKRSLLTFRDHIYHLPLLTKIFFILTILLIIGVSASVMYFNHQHQIASATEFFTTTAQSITKKKDSADGALIYQDENTARQNFTQAEDLYKKLPCATTKDQKQQDVCKKLENDLNELATKLRKVTGIQPELQVSWEQPNVSLQGMVKIGNLLLAYSPTTLNLTSYNLLTHETSTIALNSTSTNGFTQATVPVENDYALFLTPSNELYSYKPKDKTFKKVTFAPNKSNTTFSSLLVYNRRLYGLDTTNLQINRHEPIVGGFSRGTDWVKDNNQDLQNAVSFAIDGDLYALKKDGTVVKYTNGNKQEFSLHNLDPILKSGQTLFTNTDYTYIYILDSETGRILIVRKDGTVKSQLMAPEIKGASAMVIEENNKTGYFLNGNKAYKVKLDI
jgi:hypothetical protein